MLDYSNVRKENGLTFMIQGQQYCNDDDKTEFDHSDYNSYNYYDFYDCGEVHIKGKANCKLVKLCCFSIK